MEGLLQTPVRANLLVGATTGAISGREEAQDRVGPRVLVTVQYRSFKSSAN